MAFSDRVNELRNRSGLTQQELASKLGLTTRAVGAWEKGRAKPRLDKLEQLAGVLGTTSYYLLTGTDLEPNTGLPSPLTKRVVGGSGTIPMHQEACARMPEDGVELADDNVVEIPSHVAARHPNGFALEVKDHSMDKTYPKGCVILVDPDIKPWPGCTVVVETSPGVSILRRYNRGASTLMLSPNSHNPEFSDLILDDEGQQRVRTLGVVVWYQASHDTLGPNHVGQ